MQEEDIIDQLNRQSLANRGGETVKYTETHEHRV